MTQQIENKSQRNVIRLFRSPTLDTVNMVENTIEEHSGEFKKTQIWEKLPRKVMWATFDIILNYLQQINKISVSDSGIITHIWNPKLVDKVRLRKSY